MTTFTRQILFALAVGGAITLLCHACRAQSCGSSSNYQRSYGRSYSPSYSPSYSSCVPATTYSTAPTYSYAPSYSYAAPAKVYKEEPVYLRYLAVLPLVEMPSYSAAYAPAPGQQGQQPQQQTNGGLAQSEMQQIRAQNVQILDALKSLDVSVRRLEGRVENLERAGRFGSPAPKQELPPKEKLPQPKEEAPINGKITAQIVNQKMCAACHQKGNESFGGDFILSDEKGAIVKLSDVNLIAMSRVLGKGKMPKLNARAKENGIVRALSKEEAEALFGEVDRQIATDKP